MDRQSRRLPEYWAGSRTCTLPCALFHVKHAPPVGSVGTQNRESGLGAPHQGLLSSAKCEIDRTDRSWMGPAALVPPRVRWLGRCSSLPAPALQGRLRRVDRTDSCAANLGRCAICNANHQRRVLPSQTVSRETRCPPLWISLPAPRPILFSDLVHIGKPVWSRKTAPSLGASARAARPSDYTVQAVRPLTGMSKPSLPVECRRRCSPLTKRSPRVGTQIARAVRGFPN